MEEFWSASTANWCITAILKRIEMLLNREQFHSALA